MALFNKETSKTSQKPSSEAKPSSAAKPKNQDDLKPEDRRSFSIYRSEETALEDRFFQDQDFQARGSQKRAFQSKNELKGERDATKSATKLEVVDALFSYDDLTHKAPEKKLARGDFLLPERKKRHSLSREISGFGAYLSPEDQIKRSSGCDVDQFPETALNLTEREAKPWDADETAQFSEAFERRNSLVSMLHMVVAILLVCVIFFWALTPTDSAILAVLHSPATLWNDRAKSLLDAQKSEAARQEMRAIRKAIQDNQAGMKDLSSIGVNEGNYLDQDRIDPNFDRAKLSSKVVYLFDFNRKVPVFAYNAKRRMQPAGLTQMFTTLLYIELLKNPEKMAQVPQSIVFHLYEEEASMLGFSPGEEARMIDFAYGAVLVGGTECAMTEAYYSAGSEAEFAEMLNDRAKQLGLRNTRFDNSSGLPAENHYSTAEDLVRFFNEALKNERFVKVATAPAYTTAKTDFRPEGISFENSVLAYYRKHPIPGTKVLCGRTGAAPGEGRSLMTFVEKNGQYYILVTMGASRDGAGGTDHFEDQSMILSEMLK